jgi:cbb3-type cytochrome oxidase subunit 3
MIAIGTVAGVVVALGTIVAGFIGGIRWVYNRGRQAEKNAARQEEIDAVLKDIANRRQGESRLSE